MNIEELAFQVVSDSIFKQMQCNDEQIILLYDRDSSLAKILSEAYIKSLPEHAEKIEYAEEKKEMLIEKLRALPAGSNVFLVQSSNFRLDDFRIRLQLFNNGVGCLEHALLQTVTDKMIETYLNAFAWRGEEYKAIGEMFTTAFSKARSTKIYSGENSVLEFGPMEEAKINDSRFYSQKNRGGGAICGEVFSEAKDFDTVNGEVTINAYPDDTFKMVWCDPFTITIEKSFITKYSDNTPQQFIDNVITRVQEGEDGRVMVREAGFGLNPALSKETPLPYVNICERMRGFHLSVGKKHNIFRDKFSKDVIQRFHIDIFADTKQVWCDDTLMFENGEYKTCNK